MDYTKLMYDAAHEAYRQNRAVPDAIPEGEP